MKNKRENVKINVGLLIFRLVSIVIILVCSILLYNWDRENNANSELADNLSESFITEVTTQPVSDDNDNNTNADSQEESSSLYNTLEVNFDELLKQNDQTVGWIKFNNTNINFPIVQSKDNSYYLTHNFNKKSNSAGWIFADYTNHFNDLDENTIIYGHNRRNNTMFSNLKSLLNPEWFNDETNKSFIFNTTEHKYIAQIFSVYKINKNYLTLSNSFKDENDFNAVIADCKSKSVYDFNIELSYKDRIITLCTCDNNTQYRIVVFAKLVNID